MMGSRGLRGPGSMDSEGEGFWAEGVARVPPGGKVAGRVNLGTKTPGLRGPRAGEAGGGQPSGRAAPLPILILVVRPLCPYPPSPISSLSIPQSQLLGQHQMVTSGTALSPGRWGLEPSLSSTLMATTSSLLGCQRDT